MAAKKVAATLRATPTVTKPNSSIRVRERDGQTFKRLTVYIPIELADALREAAHDEWRARPPEARGREDASVIVERIVREWAAKRETAGLRGRK